MTEVPGVVICGCNNQSTAATVLISASKKTERRVKAGVRDKHKIQNTAKSKKKNRKGKFKDGMVVKGKSKTTAEKQDQKTLKKHNEPYHDILAFSEINAVSLLKNKNYRVSVSI